MRNSIKKLLSAIVCILCLTQPSIVFADNPNDRVTGSYSSSYDGISSDATHGYHIYVCGTVFVMNLATSSTIPQANTPVTSWTETTHVSQKWDIWSMYKAGYEDSCIIACSANPFLSLNINRTTYAVNIIETTGNYYRDCGFVKMDGSGGTFRLKARPRKAGESERGLIAGTLKGAKFTWGDVSLASTLIRSGD